MQAIVAAKRLREFGQSLAIGWWLQDSWRSMFSIDLWMSTWRQPLRLDFLSNRMSDMPKLYAGLFRGHAKYPREMAFMIRVTWV